MGATLHSAHALRTESGRRRVRIRIAATETVELTARLSRAGRTLARETRTLSAGTRTVRLPVRAGVKAGGARLTLELADTAGNARTIRRTLHIPRRRAAR